MMMSSKRYSEVSIGAVVPGSPASGVVATPRPPSDLRAVNVDFVG